MADVFILAKYDYLAKDPQELSLRKNERLLLLDDTKNWWKATNDQGQTGFVPSNYVRRESLVDKAKGTFKNFGSKSSGRNRSTDEGEDAWQQDAANGREPTAGAQSLSSEPMLGENTIAKFDYQPQREDELALTKGQTVRVLEKSSDGWWKGESDSNRGWFPSNYVETCQAAAYPMNRDGHDTPSGPASLENGARSGLAQLGSNLRGPPPPSSEGLKSSTKVHEVVVALYSFDAQTGEEMSFRKGEKLDIIDHPAHDPEWWLARNSQGEQGLVPTNYIQIVEHNQSGSDFGGGASPGSAAFPPQNIINRVGKEQLSGPYANQPWYYGRLSREQADNELFARGSEGDFLIRDSESNPGDYSISVKDKVRNKHFWVQVDSRDGSYKIGNRSFKSMEALIHHYTRSPIFSNEGAKEDLYLVRPLPK